MSNSNPHKIATAVKIVIEAVTTSFALAAMVVFFFGLGLVFLCGGATDVSAETRVSLIFLLFWGMAGILALVFLLRSIWPIGLSGPPLPKIENTRVENSRVIDSQPMSETSSSSSHT